MADSLVPPYSNTGVQCTTRSGLRACVDWVQVTLKNVYDEKKAFEVLDMDICSFQDQQTGLYGYKRQKKRGDIRVLYDGSEGMGVHIQLSGQGCRQYEEFCNSDERLPQPENTWKSFLTRCLSNEGEFSRFDVAIDDIAAEGQKPYFTINKVYRKAKEGCVRSQFYKGKYIESIQLDTGQSLGETMYFGKDSSDVQIRMYEKHFERMAAGKEIESGIICWNRTEVQARDQRAQAIALYIVNHDDLLCVVRGILRKYISFVIKNPTDSNKRRWDVCKWWDDFLNDAEELTLCMLAPDRTIERTETWHKKQIHPSISMVWAAHGYSQDFIVDMLEDGLLRLTDDQLKLAEDYACKKREEREEWEYIKKEKWQLEQFRMIKETKKDHPLREDDEECVCRLIPQY